MTDKKHKNEREENPQAVSKASEITPEEGEGAVIEAEAPSPTASVEEVEALHKQLAESEAKVAEYLDGWQRAQAEFINYKKRIERENATLYESARGEVIKRYLPVLDDLERALANKPADVNPAWADGIDLICRKLQAILEAEGVKRIEAEGQIFDPNLHEAISQEPSGSHQTGQVIAVVQQGYMLGDKVLRHAIVRVAQ
jgi:molecular chaperone GrpE